MLIKVEHCLLKGVAPNELFDILVFVVFGPWNQNLAFLQTPRTKTNKSQFRKFKDKPYFVLF